MMAVGMRSRPAMWQPTRHKINKKDSNVQSLGKLKFRIQRRMAIWLCFVAISVSFENPRQKNNLNLKKSIRLIVYVISFFANMKIKIRRIDRWTSIEHCTIRR